MADIVVLTGASGTLGSKLLEKMTKNYEVVVITGDNKLLNRNTDMKNIVYFDRKKLDCDDFKGYLKKKDKEIILFNMGFPRSSKSEILSEAVDDYQKLLELVLNMNIKRVVNVSSQSVYNQSDLNIKNEHSEIYPNTNYGLIKYMTEKLTRILCQYEHVEYVNVRLASITGTDYPERIINRIVKKVLRDEVIEMESGEVYFSFLSTEDAVEALYKLLEYNNAYSENIYNLGNHDYYKLNDLVYKIKKISDSKSNIILNDNNNVFSNRINSNRFYEEFKWKPERTMNHIIEDAILNYKEF